MLLFPFHFLIPKFSHRATKREREKEGLAHLWGLVGGRRRRWSPGGAVLWSRREEAGLGSTSSSAHEKLIIIGSG